MTLRDALFVPQLFALIGCAWLLDWSARHADDPAPIEVVQPPADAVARVFEPFGEDGFPRSTLGTVERGEAFPDIAFEADGRTKRLSEYEGVRIVDVWATWCGPCLAAMPKVEAFAEAHPDVVAIAACTDADSKTLAKNPKFSKHVDNHPFVGLVKETRILISAGLDGREVESPIPQFYVIDAKGRLVARQVGAQRIDEFLAEAWKAATGTL